MLSGEGVILVTERTYFPGKKFKNLLRDHQQLSSLTYYDKARDMSNKAVVKNCHLGIASKSVTLSKNMNSCR